MKRTEKKDNDAKKEKMQFIVDSLSHGWLAEERETSILFDHYHNEVHLETSHPATGRRWFENMWGDPNIQWDTKADTVKIKVPWDYARQSDLILKAKYREHNPE